MKVDEAISYIEHCHTINELKDVLQRVIEDFGFCSFNFLDVGQPHIDLPFYFGTTGEDWESDYKGNDFINVDHCVQHARKTNIPFTWDEVALPTHASGPKPGALKILDAARDHGFKNGLVVPCHFRDQLGRTFSSLSVFYWNSSLKRFKFTLSQKKHDLHIILIYWVQQAMSVIDREHRGQVSLFDTSKESRSKIRLTDRERDVLSWAARGKTVPDTSDILKIGEETIATHMRHSMTKLNASNKTHAVVKAVYLGLIDI